MFGRDLWPEASEACQHVVHALNKARVVEAELLLYLVEGDSTFAWPSLGIDQGGHTIVFGVGYRHGGQVVGWASVMMMDVGSDLYFVYTNESVLFCVLMDATTWLEG